METERTTQFASILTGSTTRRGALRFLAGLALASTGRAALEAADADAKNKKKNKGKGKGKGKGKKQGNNACARRKPLDRLQVSHDGSIVRTTTLENGRRYKLRVSGAVTGTTSLQTPVGIDAGYIYSQNGNQLNVQDASNGIDYGLSIDGEAVDWGNYDSDHDYVREIVGQGQKLALHLVTEAESEFNQSAQGELVAQRIISTPVELNLSGSLTVEIFCA